MGQAQRNDRRSGRRREVELWEMNRRDDVRRGQEQRRTSQQRPSGQRRTGNIYQTKELQVLVPADYVRARSLRSTRAVKRHRARRRKVYFCRVLALLFVALCLVQIYRMAGEVYRMVHRNMTVQDKGIVDVISKKINEKRIPRPAILEDYLEINDYSRPGTELGEIKSVFVHYTANPKTSARQNRSYFANLAQTHERSASAHFIIGYEGELIQCIPLDEQAYAVATRNADSVSIECCYLEEDGSFTQETYDTLVHTLAWLLAEYDLSTEDILRHYDCGGKKCPLYYVNHEDAWERLLADVEAYEDPAAK